MENQVQDESTAHLSRMDSSVWVRNSLILLGIFSIARAASLMTSPINQLSTMLTYGSFSDHMWPIICYFSAPVTLFIIGFILVRRSHVITARAFEMGESKFMRWEPAAYKLVATFSGLLILGWSLPKLGDFVYYVARDQYFDPMEVPRLVFPVLPMFLWFGVQISFAIYLLFGAPHIVRWQLDRESIPTDETSAMESEGAAESIPAD